MKCPDKELESHLYKHVTATTDKKIKKIIEHITSLSTWILQNIWCKIN